MVDLSEIDKKTWKCYKFDDNSVFYGSTGYVDETNTLIKDLDNYNDEMINKLKIVRHGIGIQLFGINDEDCLCRYEGEWQKDKKHGQGICYFPDKSVYEGSFSGDVFDGYGKYTWNNGDVYIGDWVNGQMEGEGEFKHNDGHILKGKFKNNYYLDVNIIYL